MSARRPAPSNDGNDLNRPVIVEVDEADDRWCMWVSGFVYGLLLGGVGGFWIAINFWA